MIDMPLKGGPGSSEPRLPLGLGGVPLQQEAHVFPDALRRLPSQGSRLLVHIPKFQKRPHPGGDVSEFLDPQAQEQCPPEPGTADAFPLSSALLCHCPQLLRPPRGGGCSKGRADPPTLSFGVLTSGLAREAVTAAECCLSHTAEEGAELGSSLRLRPSPCP